MSTYVYTVSMFGRICKQRKLRVTVGNSKVIRHVNVGQMHVRIKSKPIEEVDCFK